MSQEQYFTVLDEVDSTNNYAMGMCRKGLAKHGSCWYTDNQFQGKGQRGKTWKSEAGSGIAMSLVIAPRAVFKRNPFLLSAVIAVTCLDFVKEICGLIPCYIKWPNDIFINDKKAAGVLLETIVSGSSWSWCVAGIGLNVNQQIFDADLIKATSLKAETGKTFNPETLAEDLYEKLLLNINEFNEKDTSSLMEKYNTCLYKKGEKVTLKKEAASFQTTIICIDDFGSLVTQDTIERKFSFGDVEWIF